MKFATAAALALGLAAGAAAAEPVKIGIAAEPYPPFSTTDSSGQWVGWEIEIIGAVCKAAELDCVITPVAWDGIIPSLTSGQIDVIMNSMNITEERLKIIDFTDKYYKTPAMIVGAKGVEMTPDAAGLAGRLTLTPTSKGPTGRTSENPANYSLTRVLFHLSSLI